MTYGGMRIGLYKPIKDALDGATSGHSAVPSVYTKLAAGCASGSLAAAICNPTELVRPALWLSKALFPQWVC
jgi:hypothetical protein